MDSSLLVVDYVVIVAAVLLSAAVGFYYGVIRKKDDSVEEYFLASRELSTFKMSCSVFATLLSSSMLVGFVAEIYFYGTQQLMGTFSTLAAVYFNIKLVLPMFFQIGSYDIFKFYELKFSKQARYFLSTITIVERILASSIALYSSGAVLSQATGINIWYINVFLTAIFVLYSSLGGVRGVTLADVIQAMVIALSTVVVLIVGVNYVGGAGVVWKRSRQSGRLEFFNFDFDPQIRHTFWTSTIATFVTLFAYSATNPILFLRLMASNSLKKSQRAFIIGFALLLILNWICGVIAMAAYALYYECEPVASGAIKSVNQLLPFFVNSISQGIFGFQGLFYAGLLCSAISTLSSNLNGLAALVMETFVRPFNLAPNDQSYTRFAKISVFVIGLLCMGATSLVELFPNVYQAATVLAFSIGPQFALLLIGVCFPKANLKSSVGAFCVGIVFSLWLLIGNLLVKSKSPIKPISIAGCSSSSNSTADIGFMMNVTMASVAVATMKTNVVNTTVETVTSSPKIYWNTYFPLSSVSFTWLVSMAILATLVAFVVLSLVFGAEKDRPVDITLIPEAIQRMHKRLNKKWRKILLCDVYADDEMTAIQSEHLLNGVPQVELSNGEKDINVKDPHGIESM